MSQALKHLFCRKFLLWKTRSLSGMKASVSAILPSMVSIL
jgi:hypothetical protein